MSLSPAVPRQLLHQRAVIRKRVGGLEGCTHLVELLGPIATTAFQTLAGQRRNQNSKSPAKRPFLLDSCHALRSDGEVIKLNWPAYYTGTSTGRAG